MSKPLTSDSSTCVTTCTQKVCHSLNECKQTLSDSISTQMLIESSIVESQSPVLKYDDLETASTEVPHEIRSLLPPNNNVRALSPTHLVVFPPEIPPEYKVYNRSKTSTPQPKFEISEETQVMREIISDVGQVESTICRYAVECSEVVESNYTLQNLCSEEQENLKVDTSDIIQKQCPLTFQPSITEPIVKSNSAIVLAKEDRSESPFVAALKTAPERSYSPLPSFVDAREFCPKPTENPVEEEKPMTMADALAIAPDRSYKLPESNISTRPVGNNPVRYMHGYNKKTPAVPLLMTRSLIYSPASAIDSEEEQIASLGLKSFPPVSDELKWSTAAGDFERNESNFEYNEELVFDIPEIKEAKEPTNEEIVETEPSKPLPRHPFTASGLHEPSDIPRYQQSIPENPHRATPADKSSEKNIGPTIKNKISTFTPKPSIKNASFLKQESNLHAKVAPALGYEPSSLEGGPSKCKNITDTSSMTLDKSKTILSNTSITSTPKAAPVPQFIKESVPSTPKSSLTNDSLVEPVTPMPKSSLPAALLSKKLTCLTKKQQPKCIPSPLPIPDIGGQPTGRTGASAGLTAPRRGRGILNPQNLTPGARVPLCGQCNLYIR